MDFKHCSYGPGIFKHLTNWSNSYINFEMEDGNLIELEITMLFGNETISKAVVHPHSAAESCTVENGKARPYTFSWQYICKKLVLIIY